MRVQAGGVPRRAEAAKGRDGDGGAADGGDPLGDIQRRGVPLAFLRGWAVGARAAGAPARRRGGPPDREASEDALGKVAAFPA